MRIKDMKTGMKVKATKRSDARYTITDNEHEWQDIVIEVDEKNNIFRARTTNHICKSYIGEYFILEPQYFEPIEEKQSKKKIATTNEIPLKVTYDRDNIYVIYKDKIVAKATCCKDDNFNEEFGLNLALRRFCKTLCDENTTKKTVYNTDKVEDFI